MMNSMKFRTKQKIRKYFKKARSWSSWLSIPLIWVFISTNAFTRLHNGALMEDVAGRKYMPVVSELIMMVLTAVFLLFLLRFGTKLNLLLVALIGFVVFTLIWWFGYWGFMYTRQDPPEGFLEATIIIACLGIFTALLLGYEWYSRRKQKRKKRNKKVDV